MDILYKKTAIVSFVLSTTVRTDPTHLILYVYLGTGTQSVASLPVVVSVASSAMPTMQVSSTAATTGSKMNASNNQAIISSQSYNTVNALQPSRHSNNSAIDYGYQSTGPSFYTNTNSQDFLSSGTSYKTSYSSSNKSVYGYNTEKQNRNRLDCLDSIFNYF